MAKLTTRGNELNPYKIIQRLEGIRDLDVDGWQEFPEAIDDLIDDIYDQLGLFR